MSDQKHVGRTLHPKAWRVNADLISEFCHETLQQAGADPATIGAVDAALWQSWRIPQAFPAPASGGPNNIDHVYRAALRANCDHLTGPIAMTNSVEYGLSWIEGAYRASPRDEAHRYLEGLLAFASLEDSKVDSNRIVGDVRSQGLDAKGMGLDKLRDLNTTRFANLRLITRALANTWVGDCAKLGRKPASFGAEYPGWFFLAEWSRPDGLDADEVSGWGVDDTGCPFFADYIGKPSEYSWTRTRTSHYMPWQCFFLAMNACSMMDIESRRRKQLADWFWTRAYHDSDDPLKRGTGPTKALENPLFTPGQYDRVLSPTESGKPTGEMLWAPWLMNRARGRSWVDVGRMLEALAVQGQAYWREHWPLMLWAPEFLELAADWADGWDSPSQQKPEAEPEPEGSKSRLKAAASLLRLHGFGAESRLLLKTADAADDYRTEVRAL